MICAFHFTCLDVLEPLDEALLEEEAVQQPESKRSVRQCPDVCRYIL